ncbi:response regulator [Algoriphagus antarcticus]|uniref:Response regulator receiver domain-containing protein n=1 Tax=Algoriphagus antarcticus TaxID=238540 RepID=A0A3E0DIN0_9BACT|nr:response regulator [Algoriphagus antarcticus]REG82496.1 response regulator receiver domain-containing protein [Algoriphagus antarcticus]
MTQITKRFLLVDDDPISNLITKMMLKKSFDEVHIKDFTIPEDGLKFMKAEPSHNPPDGKTTLFLDINMPSLSGWDYLEEFELFDASIKEQYDIYILSSSVDPKDINRAKENPLVIDIIEKPLNKVTLLKMFS